MHKHRAFGWIKRRSAQIASNRRYSIHIRLSEKINLAVIEKLSGSFDCDCASHSLVWLVEFARFVKVDL